ncbi:hypothetical protein C805_00608 [Eubacterium sp. 14-2]|uniref:putative phage tail protein n=1 Tax=Eubacterium sp. 14-2 TaxID=1235790 RepID=UPI00033A5384|nr:putative phage tail protein [Eubacterium sp. 14-2]EOT26516.1 hypothetical protein C805_00608 [Eubacterium sp. 14-2]
MIREADLISFLPEFMCGYLELRKLLSAQQREVQALEDMTEILKNNQFILSADEQGIEKFETMLGIAALDDDSLENRRFRVLSRWNNAIPYTEQVLRNRLDTLCGADGYSLEIQNQEYRIKIRVALKSKKNYKMVEEMLKETVPANMVLDLSLLYNQHKTLKQFTHRQLSAFTGKQIRNEVLIYGK